MKSHCHMDAAAVEVEALSCHNDAMTIRLFSALSWGLAILGLTLTTTHSPAYFPLACISLCALFIRLKERSLPPVRHEMKLPLAGLGAFFAWEVLTSVFGGRTPLTTPFAEVLMLSPIFFIYRLDVDTEAKNLTVERTLWVLAAVFSLLVVLGILQRLTGISYPFPRQPLRDGRLYAFYKHYNQAGSILSPLSVLLVGMALFWETSALKRRVLWISASVLIVGTIMTFSRGYFVALAVTLILMLPRKSARAALSGVGVIAAVLSLLLLVSPSFRERTTSIFDLKSQPSNKERIYLMKIALDMISDYPIAGIGQKEWADKVDAYAAQYKPDLAFGDALHTNPHNLYLLVAVETGITGLLLFSMFWAPVTRMLIFRPRGLRGGLSWAMSMSAGFLIVNQFLGGFFDTNLKRPINIMFVALIVSLALLIRDDRESA